MSSSDIDLVVVGYNPQNFDEYRLQSERAGVHSPEGQVYRRERVRLGGRELSWLDALSLYSKSEGSPGSWYHPAEVYNLAAAYLTSYARARGFTAESISFVPGEMDRLRSLLNRNPTAVAVTTTFYVSPLQVIPVIAMVRLLAPDVTIVVGGPLIDNLLRGRDLILMVDEEVADILDIVGADVYVRDAQGEGTLLNVLQALSSGGELTTTPNLLVPRNGSWIATRREHEDNDLDECAIRWSDFGREEIGVTAQMRTARSCAFRCSFCDYPERAGPLTTASIDTVRSEMAALADLGVKNLVFIDDTFNVPVTRFREICEMMIAEDFGFNWYSYFRCSNVRDDKVFELARRSGCSGVFLGIESTDDHVLKNMNKKATVDSYRAGIRKLRDQGIVTFASIVVGFPGETEETVANTVDFLNTEQPDFWRAQTWWANPDSPVFRDAELFGIKGEYYDWSHETMNSVEAAEHCDRMFHDVTGSTWLPLHEMDFWSLPYLAGKGLSVTDLKHLLDLTHKLAVAEGGPDESHWENSLISAFADLHLEPSRFGQTGPAS